MEARSTADSDLVDAPGGLHRVLLVADEVVDGSDLATELGSHLSSDPGAVQIHVISPAMAHTALDQELGNVDKALPEAGRRLALLLEELQSAGFKADGRVGDSDPYIAVGDGLAEFEADEIVVVSHRDGEVEHGEKRLWDRLSIDFHPPVTQLRVSHAQANEPVHVVDSSHAPAHEKTREEVIRETRNFPPLSRRDLAGILVGFLGTLALGMIAVAAGTSDEGELSGSAAIILLIAIAAFLINVAHIVGLLLFESVRYSGVWDKFMARGSMIVTTVGLVAALLLWLA